MGKGVFGVTILLLMTCSVYSDSTTAVPAAGLPSQGQPGRDGGDGHEGKDSTTAVPAAGLPSQGQPGRDGGDGHDGKDSTTVVSAAGHIGLPSKGVPGRDGKDGAGESKEKTGDNIKHPCDPRGFAEIADKACAPIKSTEGPLSKCREVKTVDVNTAFDACRQDACLVLDNKGDVEPIRCLAIQAFADMCEEKYHQIKNEPMELPNWRSETLCPKKCDKGSKYNPSMSGCSATCADPKRKEECDRPKVEGCECDEGWLLSGNKCVRSSECGCLAHDGSYMEVGDVFVNDDCSKKCSCETGGKLKCNDEFKCAKGEQCQIKHDVRGCFAK